MSTVAVETVPERLRPRLAALLDWPERERALRFVYARHRHQYVVAHALKRLMLSAAAGPEVAPEAWRFETDPGGKPRVGPGAGPHFNLSHCDGLVACAVSRQVELGVDVECLTGDAPLELARSHFAPEEEKWLRELPSADQPLGFFRLWTLKEAYIKAVGVGLTQSLQDFAFAFDPLRVTFHDASLGTPATWRFYQRAVGAACILALAWQANGQEVPVKIRSVRFDELLDGPMTS